MQVVEKVEIILLPIEGSVEPPHLPPKNTVYLCSTITQVKLLISLSGIGSVTFI